MAKKKENSASTYGVDDPIIKPDPNGTTDDSGNNSGNNNSGNDDSGKGGGSEESSGGGTDSSGRPKPDVGVGAFGLR